MATGFDISANPQGVVTAVKQITRSLEELQRVAKGVSGDLKKLPADLQAELKAADAAFQKVLSNPKLNRGLREALRESGQMGRPFWELDPSRAGSRTYTGAAGIQAVARMAGIPVTGGQGPGGGAPPGGGGGGGSGGGGFMGGAGGAMSLATRYLLPLLGIGGAAATAYKAVSMAGDQAIEQDKLVRILGRSAETYDRVDTQVREFGKGLQLAQAESVRLMESFARVANVSDSARLVAEGRAAAGIARAYGLDPQSTVGQMAGMRYFGVGGQGAGGGQQLALLIAETIAKSGMNAKADDVVAALTRFTQQASAYFQGAPPTEKYAQLYAAFNASGMMNLQGPNAEAALSRMDATFRQGGGRGEASQAFLYRALGARDPFDFQYKLEQGLFSGDNLKNVMDSLSSEIARYPNQKMGLSAGEGLLGIPMAQVKSMMEVYKNIGSQNFGGFQDFIWGALGSDAKMTPDSAKPLADIYNAMGKPEALGGIREQLLANPDITDKQRDLLTGPGGDMAETLAQVASQLGRTSDPGVKQLEVQSQMRDTLLEIGKDMLPIVQWAQLQLVKTPGFIEQAFAALGDTSAGGEVNRILRNYPERRDVGRMALTSSGDATTPEVVAAIKDGFAGMIGTPLAVKPAPGHWGPEQPTGPTGRLFIYRNAP